MRSQSSYPKRNGSNSLCRIKSQASEKILEKLQNLVERNYIENFAFEKALIYPTIGGGCLFTRLRNLLDKYPGASLKERISIVVSEILQILSPSQKQSVNKEAYRYRIKEEIDIEQFVWKVQVYQKRIKEENAGFFGLLSREICKFFTSKTNGGYEKVATEEKK